MIRQAVTKNGRKGTRTERIHQNYALGIRTKKPGPDIL